MHQTLNLPSYLWGEHSGTGANTPAHNWLCDSALFDSLADLVFFCATNLLQGHRQSKISSQQQFKAPSTSVWSFTPHLSQYDNHLYSRSVLVAQHMVRKHRGWVSEEELWIKSQLTPHLNPEPKSTYVPIPTDGHTFKYTISGAGDYIVKFIGHAAWSGHIGHASWAIQLGGEDVIQHASRIPDLETAWLDSSNLDKTKQKVVYLN